MPRILVHVGLPKTGTTSLQNYLYRNGSVAGDLHYCHFFDGPIIQSRCFANAIGLGNDSGCAMTPVQYADKVKSVFDAGCTLAVISDETLSRINHLSPELLSEMMERLQAFSKVEFVLGLRPWFSWLESLINQSIKTGHFSIEDFDANDANEINMYPVKLLSVYEFYRNGGSHKRVPGREFPVHVVRQPEGILDQFERISGRKIFDRSLFQSKNLSPPISQSVNMYLSKRGMDTRFAKGGDWRTFLSSDHALQLYTKNAGWIARFSELLGSTDVIDDHVAFRAQVAERGAIDIVRDALLERKTA